MVTNPRDGSRVLINDVWIRPDGSPSRLFLTKWAHQAPEHPRHSKRHQDNNSTYEKWDKVVLHDTPGNDTRFNNAASIAEHVATM